TNLTFSGGLPKLTNITLGGKLASSSSEGPFFEYNRVANFSFLTNLSNLASLDLPLNGLTTLELPESFTNLTRLNLGGNRLTSFSFLRNLHLLKELLLYDNQLPSLSL